MHFDSIPLCESECEWNCLAVRDFDDSLIAYCTPAHTHTHTFTHLVSALNGTGDQSLNEPYYMCLDCTRYAHREKNNEHIYTQIAFSWHLLLFFFMSIANHFAFYLYFYLIFLLNIINSIPFRLLYKIRIWYLHHSIFVCFSFLWNSRTFVLTPNNSYIIINCTIVAYKHKILWSARTLNNKTNQAKTQHQTFWYLNLINLGDSSFSENHFRYKEHTNIFYS